MEPNGGRIDLAGDPGARFVVLLPAATAAERAAEADEDTGGEVERSA